MINNIITDVLLGSIAEELEVEKGDQLVSINDAHIKDYIDYKFQISDEYIVLEIKKQNGEIWDLEIEKEIDEDLGIVFENPLMDNIKVCKNKCIFCFVDQTPRGMRRSLYLKDDDTRLSFLYGNYITLTNLTEDEMNRIIKYHISPMKVSVHTTDIELRNEMMGKKTGNIMEYLKRLADGGITVDCQVVLCRDYNDGDQLNKTIDDLSSMHPMVRSIAVVPVGLTDYRDRLTDLKSFEKEDCIKVIKQVEAKQREMLDNLATRFVFISDEFYVVGEREFPSYESYEKFDQLEDGIGLCRLFDYEVRNTLDKIGDFDGKRMKFFVATGQAAYKMIKKVSSLISEKLNIDIEVVEIINDVFGHKITVTGLVTGKDLINQFKEKYLDKGIEVARLIMPKVMVEHEDEIFLDDVTLKEVEFELNTELIVSNVDGKDYVETLMKRCV